MTLKTDLLSDLDEIFDTDEFAVEATLTGGIKIKVIFDDEFRGQNIESGEIRTTAPQVLCKSADVSGVALGNTITINSVAYKVIERQPDGTGCTTLILSRD